MLPDRTLRRIFEIIPGLMTWSTLLSLFVLAFIKPLWVAIFIITFDIYWVIRITYLTVLLWMAYKKLEQEKSTNWFKKIAEIPAQASSPRPDSIYHAVLFPSYKEGPDVLGPSIAALENTNYPKDKIVVILSVEERAGIEVWKSALALKEKHENNFSAFLVTRHPDNLPGEVKVKGANATWGAKVLKDFLDSRSISYENVIISCFDADTCADKEYFGCLAYHFLANPRRFQSSYQPIPVYNNNIWYARSIGRILEMSASFMQMIETMRLEKFVTFSSHSMSFKTLVDVDYWPVDMISDDSVIYWRCFLYFQGEYNVIPMYVTVSMDVATGKTIMETVIKQYRQKRRWAWGVENFPYVMMGFLDKASKIPLRKKIRRTFNILESYYTWAVWAIIITFIAPLPLILGGGIFRQTAIGYNLPGVSATLFNMSLFTIFVCIIITVRLLPPRPRDVKPGKRLIMVAQWFISPLVAALLGSTPAVDAQTRLMFGRYMRFQFTEKSRPPH